jgi:hypothetical protein
LWLRFVGDSKEGFRLFSFGFLNPFLPPKSGVVVRAHGKAIEAKEGKNVEVRDQDVHDRVQQWIDWTKDPN